jgi:hypothetical protein
MVVFYAQSQYITNQFIPLLQYSIILFIVSLPLLILMTSVDECNAPDDASNGDDDDDDEIVQESLRDSITKQSFVSMIDSATTGSDVIKITDLLPNSSQRYGHSITMNAMIKIVIHHPIFRERSSLFYTVKVKKGKETSVPSTFTSLNQANKQLIKDMIHKIRPDHGPWLEVTQLLHNCDEAFNDSAAALWQIGMPANWNAYVSHMLCDERVLACLIPISVPVQAQERPAMLDHLKETEKSLSDAAYEDLQEPQEMDQRVC